MKRLMLMRHAKSSWDQPDLPDFDRPLNKRGKRDAPLMARRLCELGEKPDLILSSPAERAIRTAMVVAEELGIPKKENCSKRRYLFSRCGAVARNFEGS
jgi:phosphohistidine phosphatase